MHCNLYSCIRVTQYDVSLQVLSDDFLHILYIYPDLPILPSLVSSLTLACSVLTGEIGGLYH